MHKAHSLTLHTDGMGATPVHIPDIIAENLTNNPTVEFGVPNHDKYPTHLSLMSHVWDKQVDTFAVKAALDAIGVGGLCINTVTNPGVLMNLAKIDTCGDITAGAVHRSYKYLSGLVFPRTLTVEHRGDARLSLGIAIVKKDANDVVVLSDTLTLPTLTIASARWTIGEIEIAGNTLTDFTRLEIDFGFRVETRGVESDLYDKYIEIKRVEPMWNITGINPGWFAAAVIPVGGAACTHANTIAFLRKRDPDGNGFVIDATAEHLKFSANGVALVTSASTSNEDRFADTALRVYGRKDSGGNAPVVYTGAIAIT